MNCRIFFSVLALALLLLPAEAILPALPALASLGSLGMPTALGILGLGSILGSNMTPQPFRGGPFGVPVPRVAVRVPARAYPMPYNTGQQYRGSWSNQYPRYNTQTNNNGWM